MPFNPDNERDLARLAAAISNSRARLEPFRKRVFEANQEYLGCYYGDQIAPPNHVNFLEVAVNTYMAQLISNPPRVWASTSNSGIRPSSEKLGALLNAKLKENQTLFHSLQRCVRSSMFSMGIMKIGLVDGGTWESEGEQFALQEPYMRPVLHEDWVQDMVAKTWEEISFMGNRYTVDYEWLMENNLFEKKAKERASKSRDMMYNEQGDQRLVALQRSGDGASDETGYYDVVELWDIYLPRERLIITMPCNLMTMPLRVVEFDGPDHGPYRQLRYNDVDGNSIPLPPVMTWMGLHRTGNSLYRKLDRQAARQKTITICRGKDSTDASRMLDCNDGKGVALNNPEAAKEVSSEGSTNATSPSFLQTAELFKWVTGGLDTIGGLGTGARTVGQEERLNANASQRISQMRNEVHRFTQGCLEDYGFYMWQDPLRTYPVVLDHGERLQISEELSPEERSHDYYEHNVTIDVHSMAYRSPSEKLSTILELVQMLGPMLPMMSQQGVELAFKDLLKLISRAADIPEFDRIFQYAQNEPMPTTPGQSSMSPGGRGGAGPPSTGQQPGESSQAAIMGMMAEGSRSSGNGRGM